MTSVKFILVGCGNIGVRHAALMHQFGKLEGVCDVDESKAKQLAEQYHCKAFGCLNDLLTACKNAAVLVICTPNALHAPQAIQGLHAGFHVLVPKSMAISALHCRAMIDAASQAGKLLMVVKQNRFNPPVLAVKHAIEQALLGKIYSVHLNCLWYRDEAYYMQSKWRGTKQLDGGILFTQFSHFIDILLWFMGSDVKVVAASAANLAHQNIIEFEDTGVAQLQFANGALGSIHYSINAFQQNAEGSILLNAENGIIKIGGKYLDNIAFQTLKHGDIACTETSAEANDYGSYQGSIRNHDKVYAHFIEILLHNKASIIQNEEAMQTVALIESIHKCIQHNSF
ncbi:Gfo/Idh/MocA family oxidoreductase [Hydrotalea sp.]|uniref:Gfo/Idh/MocA family protein n=1 Tax=Hydrotalea sp. TaxID=2881279 RepID=UPI00258ED233|nr:Gfo/Idh/MocA family oxidoreductase [Hydrotalea sp.]